MNRQQASRPLRTGQAVPRADMVPKLPFADFRRAVVECGGGAGSGSPPCSATSAATERRWTSTPSSPTAPGAVLHVARTTPGRRTVSRR